jgi:Dyp-type peroxidase family
LLSTAHDRTEVRKTRHLQGISDLTLLAPLKTGLIDALDARTYESRARTLMKSLHSLRVTSREYSLFRPFVDTAARIRTIHSLRLAIIDREKLLLAVTFDRPWEPYIRSIWGDVGPLLDVIFCNCEGYVLSSDHSFEEYMHWVRSVQVETNFFFSTNSMTVDDLQYLKQVEQIHREAAPGFELRSAQETLKDPQQLAAAVCSVAANQPEILKQGMLALSALHRLVDLYTPEADGDVLLRATHELLKGFPTHSLPEKIRARFGVQLAWFERELPKPRRPPHADVIEFPTNEVQGGILSDLRDTQSCLLLFAIDDAASAARFLTELRPQITTEAGANPEVHLNVAFTYQGLRQLGLHEAELSKFSAEFREGMEARAGLLGDVLCNHPRNWRLPQRNWPTAPARDSSMPRVELSMVHLVIRLGLSSAPVERPIQDPLHPLHAHIVDLAARARGLTLLSVEAATRREPGHFGYSDGLSQPAVNQGAQGRMWPNNVPLGDVLLGHGSRFDFAKHDPLLDNGSYIAVRKLQQDAPFFHDQMAKGSQHLGIAAEVLKAKLMGRTLAGEALANPSAPASNDFNYEHDSKGALCPFAAHVRRANPRTADTPRIVRRGMSYGPSFDPANPSPAERGLYFMAYNSSLAEQFEVVQRWISGGNSTGVYSGEADPLLGVPALGEPRNFRFQHTTPYCQTTPLHIELTDDTARPFVTLEWGLYLFVPSLTGLTTLIGQARRVQAAPDVEAGGKLLDELLKLGVGEHAVSRWKTVLEDVESRICGTAASVWAAIRKRHGGVLRTAYGVLVCNRKLVLEVFANSQYHYTATDYLKRMDESLGKIYLGKDAGPEYDSEARDTNAAIQQIKGEEAFGLAYHFTRGALDEFIQGTKRLSAQAALSTWELTLDLKELSDTVLAKLSAEWFDIPDGKHILSGGWRWDWQPSTPPLCPGHFTAPSRYTFQPHPGASPQRYGKLHGKSLRAAMNQFVKERRAAPNSLHGRLSRAMFAAFPAAKDNDLLARNLVGVMMGFLPAVDGNLRGTLYEWIEHRTLWEVQQAYLSSAAASAYDRAMRTILHPLMNTMRLRPVPELVWRTARARHQLGGVDIKPKDHIVLAIVSATQEDRLNGDAHDVYPIFGGNRRDTPQPTHGCPAYDSGMGILLGIIAGLCDSHPMRPTPAPLTLTFSGDL